MYKLSVLIPARNEMWLAKTIEDILEHSGEETEIIVGLDGLWADPPIADNKRVTIVHVSESIGQRAMTNQLCRLSKAKYVMKIDAHVAMDQDFDKKMFALFDKVGDNVTMAPTMRNLHVFNWLCKNGHRRYQGPSGPCTECKEPTEREVVWIPKTNPSSTSYLFDPEPHFQYFNEFKNRPEYSTDPDYNESMSLQGSCFMMTRDKYWELNICDEEFGSWGSQGIEVACKTWLSGGRVIINHNTWYAHLFRTQGEEFGFPYPISYKQTQAAKSLAGNKLYENKWPRQVYPSSWLVQKFWPCKGWTDADLAKITKSGESFINTRFEELRVLGIIGSVPSSVTDHTTTVASDGWGEKVSIVTSALSKIFSSSTVALENIISVRNELEVGRITAPSVITSVVKNGDVLSFSAGDITNQPSINKPVGTIPNFVDSNISVPVVEGSSPVPALSNGIRTDFGDNSSNGLIGDFHNTIIPSRGCIFYTDNLVDEKVGKAVRKQLWKAATRDNGLPIVSCSLKPLDFGKNIVFNAERGYLTMFKQILTALENLNTDIVYFCEHDVLYHPDHFKFIPPKKDVWYYNENYWFLRLNDGFAISYNCSPLSGLVVYRDAAIKHYRERVEMFEKDPSTSVYRVGFEPMTHGRIKWENSYKFETFKTGSPNIDISHGKNVTSKRWSIDLFRRKPTRWEEGDIDTITGWNNVKKLLA